ncbi:hypothetical protein MLD38_027744 [Melastoma candidum]|uniref:Uncharacterized protein n=1 Tax=Melastoma candidum TaxID=119954 RepID=A0ACB9P3N2_9MYRT|nr:hypothetical protein MLD38_027744 [Melastoma candidum]
MTSMKRLAALMVIAVAIICSLGFVKGEDLTSQGGFCNKKIDADESTEEWDVSYPIWWLIQQTPIQGYHQHLSYNGYYGVAACNGQISQDDCNDCLEYANNMIFTSCGFGDGAQLRLADCRLRFEHYQFPDDW